MIRMQQLKLPVAHTEEQLTQVVLKALSIPESDLIAYHIRKRSLDARKKPRLFYSYVIDAKVKGQNRILKKKKPGIEEVKETR